MTKLEPCPLCGDPMAKKGQIFGHTDSDLPCILARYSWPAEARFITVWNTRIEHTRTTASAGQVEAIKDGLDGWIGISDIDECAASVLAALSQPPERDALVEVWQPIETAPNDHTQILGCWPHSRMESGWACCVFAGCVALEMHEKVKAGVFNDAPHLKWAPTHWQPLPEPPAALKEATQ